VNLYLCNGTTLAGTQAAAKKLDPNFEAVEIPITPKEKTIEALNALLARVVKQPPALPKPGKLDMDAGAVLARLDGGGPIVDQIVKAIHEAKGYALRSFAGAVAVRFQRLSEREKQE
jgi:hypothetical protein